MRIKEWDVVLQKLELHPGELKASASYEFPITSLFSISLYLSISLSFSVSLSFSFFFFFGGGGESY